MYFAVSENDFAVSEIDFAVSEIDFAVSEIDFSRRGRGVGEEPIKWWYGQLWATVLRSRYNDRCNETNFLVSWG